MNKLPLALKHIACVFEWLLLTDAGTETEHGRCD